MTDTSAHTPTVPLAVMFLLDNTSLTGFLLPALQTSQPEKVDHKSYPSRPLLKNPDLHLD